MKLERLQTLVLDGSTKGLPAATPPLRLAEIGKQGWSVLNGDLPMPVAVVRQSVLLSNSRWMRAYLGLSGTRIAPHGKTTMCPQLFATQLADGACAITVASVQQLKVCRDFGIKSLLLANQLTGKAEIAYVLAELRRDPGFEFMCFVDSIENARELAAAAHAADLPRPIEILLEIGFPGGRTGCRTQAAALDVAREIARAPDLSLRGVAGFEGLFGGATVAEAEAKIRVYLDFVGDIAVTVEKEALFAEDRPIILSAGGSGYFDIVVDAFSAVPLQGPREITIRSGCYLTHDGHMYRDLFGELMRRHPQLAQLGGGLQPALQVWARVQSRPEPGKVILGAGKRDISYDIHLPTPVLWYRTGMSSPQTLPPGHVVTGLNDQHCHMSVPTDGLLAVGDLIALDISHPCTTFDKWQILHVVDDEMRVVDALKTYF